MVGEHGDIQAGMVLEKELRVLDQPAEERDWTWLVLFKISEPTPSDILPPTRPHPLILLN